MSTFPKICIVHFVKWHGSASLLCFCRHLRSLTQILCPVWNSPGLHGVWCVCVNMWARRSHEVWHVRGSVTHPLIPLSLLIWRPWRWHVMNDSAGPQIFHAWAPALCKLVAAEEHISFWSKGCQRGHRILVSTKLPVIKHFINAELQTWAQTPDSTTGVRLARIPASIEQRAFVLERLYTSHLNKHEPSGKNTTSRRRMVWWQNFLFPCLLPSTKPELWLLHQWVRFNQQRRFNLNCRGNKCLTDCFCWKNEARCRLSWFRLDHTLRECRDTDSDC